MSKRKIGLEIFEGIEDIKAHKAGVKVLITHPLKELATPQEISSKLNLSQVANLKQLRNGLRNHRDPHRSRQFMMLENPTPQGFDKSNLSNLYINFGVY